MPIQTAIDSISNSQGSPFGFKNRIINGAIVIDQRQAGSNVAASAASNGGYHTADRWASSLTQSSKLTFQQVADAPTGFKYSMKLTSVSSYTPLSSDYFGVMQLIEGYNVADLDYGLSTAKATSLSFWVKSSITGTFSGSLYSATNKGNPFSYTISAANTWTYVTINNIVGDTATALYSTTNGIGLYVYFSFGAGSSQLGSAGTWQNGTILGVTGQTNHIATNGATLQITGVQLEKGTQATSFDYRDYGNELRMCQRYYEKSYAPAVPVPTNASNNAYSGFPTTVTIANGLVFGVVSFKVQKRADPTVVTYSYASSTVSVTSTYAGTDQAAGSAGVSIPNVNNFNIYNGSGGTITPTSGGFVVHWAASAEL